MSSSALQDALRNARSVEHVAEAFEAGMKAAYTSGLQFGHDAAIEVLNRKVEEEAPAVVEEQPSLPPSGTGNAATMSPPANDPAD